MYCAKKILCSIIFVSFICIKVARAQTSGFAKTYTTQAASTGSMAVSAVVYGNSLFNIYSSANMGLTIQKNDLDGIPVLTKEFVGFSPTNVFTNLSGGYMYLAGTITSLQGTTTIESPFVCKIDTANCAPLFFNLYSVNNSSFTPIYDCRIHDDQNQMYLAGRTSTALTNAPQYGYVLNINLQNGGTVNASYTMAVSTSTTNYISSICPISNSSLLFGAGTIIGKIIGTPSSMIFGSAYASNTGSGKIFRSSNSKKMIVSGLQQVYKVDTNLTLINSANNKTLIYGNTVESFFFNDHLYRFDAGNWRLNICDTSLATITSAEYFPIANSQFQLGTGFARNATNLFFTQAPNSSTNKFFNLRTDLAGLMACSTPTSVNSLSIAVNGSSVALSSGTVNTTKSVYPASLATRAVPYAITCSNTFVKNQPSPVSVSRSGQNTYLINSDAGINSYSVFDVQCRELVRSNFPNKNYYIDLSEFTNGVYLIQLNLIGGNAAYLKIVNY